MCNMYNKCSYKILTVQGVLLTLAFNLHYEEVTLYSFTELTAMIKVTRSEAEIKHQDDGKKLSRKLIAKLPSVLNAKLNNVPEMFLQIPILA